MSCETKFLMKNLRGTSQIGYFRGNLADSGLRTTLKEMKSTNVIARNSANPSRGQLLTSGNRLWEKNPDLIL